MKISVIAQLEPFFVIGAVNDVRLKGLTPTKIKIEGQEECHLQDFALSMPEPHQESPVKDQGMVVLLAANGVDEASIVNIMIALEGRKDPMMAGFASRAECITAVDMICFPSC